jgi:hypothetical protein
VVDDDDKVEEEEMEDGVEEVDGAVTVTLL